MAENESTYIPAGVIHFIENTEGADLETMEMQLGFY